MPMRRALLLASCCLALGCPTQVEHKFGQRTDQAPAQPDEKDPRVVKNGEDLYAAEAVEKTKERDPAPEAEGKGSGRSDESNGVCRLYAPKLKQPNCCEANYGFDVAEVKETCGLEIYLGESFQFSCGYYFTQKGGGETWFRSSFLPSKTAAEAASTHDRKMQQITKNKGFKSTPVPGVKDALWSSHEGLNWAFIPGWSRVRQLAWRDTSCSKQGAAALIKKLAAAKEPPQGTPRASLVPKAFGA